MEVISFVHEGLGNSSYLVPLGNGIAAAVDPDRSVGKYLRTAEERSLRIAAVFETHLHADFVTGSLELSRATGARLFVPAQAQVRFEHEPLREGERVTLEGVAIETFASPGHTPEHTSYLFRSPESRPPALFSGGSLIVGGAARTDLLSPDLTDGLTRAQYRTLRDAFAQLPDETLLYPTHGGGSFCSTGAGGDRTSTLGRERTMNPLLRFDDEYEFARWFPSTFPATPAYFASMRAINQKGPRPRARISDPPPLSPAEFQAASAGASAVIVDARPVADYLRSHIPGSLSIAFRPSFATWVGWLVPLGRPLLFVTDGAPPEAVVSESLLVGHEKFAGRLEGGIDAWKRAGLPLRSITTVDAGGAREAAAAGATLIDVRERGEYESGHIEGALHVPLGSLSSELGSLTGERPLIAYCGVGERSTTAVSILERAGFSSPLNLEGGFRAWRKAGEKVVA